MLFHELPRDEAGRVTGSWKLRHIGSRDYNDAINGVVFVNGETVAPVSGRQAEQFLATFDWCDALPWEEASKPEASAPAGSGAAALPSTWAELEALSTEELRARAAALNYTDKRAQGPRLRKFLADELGIQAPEGVAHA